MSLIVANWKMNGLKNEAQELLSEIGRYVQGSLPPGFNIVICPPFTLFTQANMQLANTSIALGGQNCHHETHGAYTGEISPEMLYDSGCEYVIIGHSERRKHNHENNALLNQKIETALDAGLKVIFCVGETAEERKNNQTEKVITKQLQESLPKELDPKRIFIAYEPVWAIGSGHVPSPQEIATATSTIRKQVGEDIHVLYGGSVNAKNAREILFISGVSGLLVGGASLKPKEFIKIIEAGQAKNADA